MRIISWNRKRGITNKLKEEAILSLNPDLLIYQEYVPSPNRYPADSSMSLIANVEFPERIDKNNPDALRGRNGMAIFSRNSNIKVKIRTEFDYKKDRFFIPMEIKIKDKIFNLLVVWLYESHEKFEKVYHDFIAERETIIIGDFNWPGNKIYTGETLKYDPTAGKGKSLGVHFLFDYFRKFGLASVYHEKNNIELGSDDTVITHLCAAKSELHIDYCFMPKKWLADSEFTIGIKNDWITTKFSDHCPLILDLFTEKTNHVEMPVTLDKTILEKIKINIPKDTKYRHNRSDEENLTERMYNILRTSDEFTNMFINKIYTSLKNKNFGDLSKYRFYSEWVKSEWIEKNCNDTKIQFDLHLVGEDSEKNQFHILIENKVGDQIHTKQIKKYYNYLKKHRGLLVAITKTGTCYEKRDDLIQMLDGHLYWNDIDCLLETFNSTEPNIKNLKKEVTEKIKALDCSFYQYPCALKPFNCKISESKEKMQNYRKELKKISDPLFQKMEIFDKVKAPHCSVVRKNTPVNTISYQYKYRLIKNNDIGSINLWISFGPKIYSPMTETLEFKQPKIDIDITLPSQLPSTVNKDICDEYVALRNDIIEKLPLLEGNTYLYLPSIPLLEVTENPQDINEMFNSIKNKFEEKVEEWFKKDSIKKISDLLIS